MSKTSKSESAILPESEDTKSAHVATDAQAPVVLGTLRAEVGDGWLVQIGSSEKTVSVDPSVDPALLVETAERGSRVLIDQSDEPIIVGVVMTQRSLIIDEQGCVDAEVEKLTISANTEVLLKTPGAYLRARKRKLEIYGNKVLTRGRELAKTLAAMIEFN